MTIPRTWDEIRALMLEVQGYIPKYDPCSPLTCVGRFVYNQSKFEQRCVTFFKQGNESFFTNVFFLKKDVENGEDLFLQIHNVREKRSLMIAEDVIYDEPVLFNDKTPYPVFHEYWKRDKAGRGVLKFFRIDLSSDTFASYTHKARFRATKEGDVSLFDKFPDSIEGLDSVFGHTIMRTIDFEARAREILALSLLREFVDECKKIAVVN